MKKIVLLIIITLFYNLKAFSQNFIYEGDNQYESTGSWDFKLNGNYWTTDPKITVAKNNSSGGYLMISIEVPFQQHYIKGTVFVFLEDGSVIKCFDKGVRDHVDNQSIALYNFTSNEIDKLKEHRISKIRFTIYTGNFNNNTETFTADNRKSKFQLFGSNDGNYYPTNAEIKELFN